MRDIWVTTSKHEVVLHSEDPNNMTRHTMHLSYREAVVLYESLSRILTHPEHKAAFIPQQRAVE